MTLRRVQSGQTLRTQEAGGTSNVSARTVVSPEVAVGIGIQARCTLQGYGKVIINCKVITRSFTGSLVATRQEGTP